MNCKYVKRFGESCTLNNNCKYPNCEVLVDYKNELLEEIKKETNE